ncbi:N-methylhydantoinase A/oxoprolinase/acetone carboxylase beta subunit [Halarchaeum solikamskense]|uniref:hydantoinase/oxoprolinase family protein n=1 Tax=Halarchaeum nitratireducens TaxID=489913 RepID=UPI001B3A90DB|nr:hydantoinase/oxoprolinase family protein [Halarchaeum solikamskense]MBP2252455.1 N-methylhydantoinase A/oxoprolinase/acetone carboxylase beta subunit [Halarchaeum solikamskense]
MKILGIDIGGTFTDVYLTDDDVNERTVHKVSTTPDDPSEGALRGVHEVCEMTDTPPGELDYVFHGTTIATNAVLEHEGVEVGMITTAGYRDIVHIGRHKRPQNYSIQQDVPWQQHPLTKRRHRMTVPERIDADGTVRTPLDEDAVAEAARALDDAGVDSIAVAFLFSYLNDEHEARAKEIIEDVSPDVYVTTSSEVYPQFREFERFTTTAMNAAIGPTVVEYIETFERELRSLGVTADLHVMQSNGGIATEEMVTERAVTLLLSGPAAGILGGKRRTDVNTPDSEATNAITLDMGGTSADIGIVADDEIVKANVRETQVGGYPVMIPMIDIETIGAGGGSIAYLDDTGAFRVGPKSAGAMPGPIAYDRGGTDPTVTDAHVALGRIRPEFFLGGEMDLLVDAPRETIRERLADPLGMDEMEAAAGVLRIVNNGMANAIRSKTVQKGRDPENFTLVAFGGAGPMHAADVARELDVSRTLIPASSGVLSAVGLSTTDLQFDQIHTTFETLSDLDRERLQSDYDALVADAEDRLHRDGVADERIDLELSADCRYEGQGYELTVPVSDGRRVRPIERIDAAFDAAHESEFGHGFDENAVELVNERVTAYGRLPTADLVTIPEATSMVEEHVLFKDDVYFDVDGEIEAHATPFVDRTDLRAGHSLSGPAIIAEKDSTIIVPPDFDVSVLQHGDIELTR